MSYSKDTLRIPADLFYWIGSRQGSQKEIIELSNCILVLDTNLVGRNEKKHPTEEKYPEQCKMFREIIEKMYSVHLDKNQDYSPMNVLATGLNGLATRIWDKTIRFVSLLGLDIRTGEWHQRKEPKNESINDNLLDLANYAIICLIYLAGRWGK